MAEQDENRKRLECEARYWLGRGYTTTEKVKELTELLSKKRGQAAIEALVEEMRNQWRSRSEWLGKHG